MKKFLPLLEMACVVAYIVCMFVFSEHNTVIKYRDVASGEVRTEEFPKNFKPTWSTGKVVWLTVYGKDSYEVSTGERKNLPGVLCSKKILVLTVT